MTNTMHRAARGERTVPLRDLTATTASPVAVVRANLMPPEVVAKRRLRWLRRRLAFTLVMLLLLVGLGYGLTLQQTSSSEDDLAATQQQTTQFDAQLRKFDALLKLQSQTTTLKTQLVTVMTGDVQWSALLARITAAAPAGIVVEQVAGKVNDSNAPALSADDANTALLPANTKLVGLVLLSGKARDYRSVSAFVDALSKIKGFVRVEPGEVTAGAGGSSFTVGIALSSDVQGGRFSPKAVK